MFCKNCRNQLIDGSKFCPKCGQKIDGDVEKKTESISQNPFAEPGQKYDMVDDGEKSPKDSCVAGLLSLFFGPLGIHDFYCGKSKNGIIKLILSITVFFSFIPAIWNIVDLFHIGTGKYVDGDNLPLKAAPWAKWIVILQFIAVALLFVLLITSILGIGAANNSIAKSKASEISPAFGTYIMMQDANFADCVILDDCYGSFDYIGYTPPASVNFYYEDVGFGMRAIAKTSLGDCPQGAVWSVKANIIQENNDYTLKYSCDVDPECESLTPSFKKLCEK